MSFPLCSAALRNRARKRAECLKSDFYGSIWIDVFLPARPEGRSVGWPGTVDLVVFDFDGVMTDDTVYISEDGTEQVRCSRSDGFGVSSLLNAHFSAMVLSMETNPVVEARCRKLRLPVAQGCSDKGSFLAQFVYERKVDPGEVVYLGNDVNDLACFDLVGFPVAVADAKACVRERAEWVTTASGGRGAVRELCDLLIAHSSPRQNLQSTASRSAR